MTVGKSFKQGEAEPDCDKRHNEKNRGGIFQPARQVSWPREMAENICGKFMRM